MNRVAVASDPPLAVITADGDPVGETPVTVPLSRRDWWGRGRGGVVLKQFMDNEGFKRWMTDRVFELACKQAGAAAATTRSAP